MTPVNLKIDGRSFWINADAVTYICEVKAGGNVTEIYFAAEDYPLKVELPVGTVIAAIWDAQGDR